MKPRRLESETMVSRLAMAGATALASTVGVVTGRAPLVRDRGRAARDCFGPILAGVILGPPDPAQRIGSCTPNAPVRRRARPGHHEHAIHRLRPRGNAGRAAPAGASPVLSARRLGRARP